MRIRLFTRSDAHIFSQDVLDRLVERALGDGGVTPHSLINDERTRFGNLTIKNKGLSITKHIFFPERREERRVDPLRQRRNNASGEKIGKVT